jgi:protein gp37
MSKIEWTEQTWNPIIGCSKKSKGCDNCYAEKMAVRLANISTALDQKNWDKNKPEQSRQGLPQYCNVAYTIIKKWTGLTAFVESAIEKPLKRKKPTVYFVCSMGDLFHDSVPFEWIDQVFAVMALCPQHTFQVLTKRPERMAEYLAGYREKEIRKIWWNKFKISTTTQHYTQTLPNVWLGTSCEDQAAADERIPHLLRCPAKVRFVSVEPMLGAVDLETPHDFICQCSACKEITKQLDWVICGGESGSNARPMHPDWVRSLRDQCVEAGVPFFFKQWGEWREIGKCLNTIDDLCFYDYPKCRIVNIDGGQGYHGEKALYVKRYGKKKAGRLLDGRVWDQMPEVEK